MEVDPIEQGCLRETMDMNHLIEEKMFEIAHILGINVEGRIGELRTLIREMFEQESGCKLQSVARKDIKKPKWSRELLNLVSSTNYESQGGNKKGGKFMST